MHIEFQTERLFIRQFTGADREEFIAFMTNPSITNNLAFDSTVKTKEGAEALLKQTIKSYNSNHPLLAFAIENKDTSSFLGACGIVFLNPQVAEVFYALFPCYWGKGFATEVLSKLKEDLINRHSVKEIHAFIGQQNTASMKVAEKAGFISGGLVTKENFENKVYDCVLIS